MKVTAGNNIIDHAFVSLLRITEISSENLLHNFSKQLKETSKKLIDLSPEKSSLFHRSPLQ